MVDQRRLNQVYTRMTCRACRNELEEVLNLGNLHLNDFPKHPGEIGCIPRVYLILCFCRMCGLAQLRHTTPADWLYRNYWYRSNVNEMMVRELQEIVGEGLAYTTVASGNVVIDIGANDGTLLKAYREHRAVAWRVAVEPALNLQSRWEEHAEAGWPDYFPHPDLLAEYSGRARIVTAVAMCYDLEDPLGFFAAIRQLLHPEGLCIVQFQDMGQMLETSAFDNICHEHLEYYTLHSLYPIVHKVGLTVTRCVQTPINGGSLRVHLRRADRTWAVGPNVEQQYQREAAQGLSTLALQVSPEAYLRFGRRVRTAMEQIHATFEAARLNGSVVDVYGASTKGNILLQVMNISSSDVRQAIDRSPEKHGYHTITGIPIVGEEQAKVEPADAWLVPIWQFRPSVLKRERWYLRQGGQMIFPLPQCEVVKESWEVRA